MYFVTINVIKKDGGFSLIYSLFMIFIISTVLLAVYQLTGFYNKLDSRAISKFRLQLDCYSAAQKCIASFDTIPYSGMIKINSSNVKYEKRSYGLFQYLVTSNKSNHDSTRTEYLIGNSLSPVFRNALIFSSPNFRSSVSGNTKISGDILASSDKINTAFIFGIDPPSKDYHAGKINFANNIGVKIFKDTLIKCLFNIKADSSYFLLQKQLTIDSTNYKEIFSRGGNYKYQGDITFNSLINFSSFNKGIKVIVKGRAIINSGANIDFGKMSIYSDSIEINNNCNIANLVCVSKGKIKVNEQCNFRNTQLFSSDDITITGSHLFFPSVICLYNITADTSKKNPSIYIKSSNINGNILLVCDYSGIGSNKSKIFVDEKSKVQGIIYSENNTDLRGDLIGSLYTLNTWYYKEPTEYNNWLINMKIDRTKLDKNFTSCLGFKVNPNYRIIDEKNIY